MKEKLKKIADWLKIVFGYGILISVFLGGITFFGYVAALIIGGETAALICTFIYKTFFAIVIKFTNILVLLGLVIIYLNGEKSLAIGKKKSEK